MRPYDSELLHYRSTNGVVRVQCRLDGDSAWRSQRFGVGAVNHPIQAIFAEGELSPEATLRRYRIVQDLGSRAITHGVDPFGLPMILAMGAGCGAPLSTTADGQSPIRARRDAPCAPFPTPRAAAEGRRRIRAPASPTPNFFRLPLLHPLAA